MSNKPQSLRVALLCLCSVVLSPIGARAQAPTPGGVLNPLAAQSLDRLSATRERPLFTPSRRPPAPPPPVASTSPVASAAPVPKIALSGIVIASDGARAVVNDMTTNKIVRVRLGDELDGWKVSQIDERSLVLWRDGQSASFKLFSGESKPPPAAQSATTASKQLEPGQHPPHRRRSE